MKMKIAIIDDEVTQREYLLQIVNAWAQKNYHFIEVKQYSGARSFLFDYDTEKDFDILLLDIEMPYINGIELAKKIRKENEVMQIIFVTGFIDYFSDGYDVSALHYLIKPVSETRICSVLDRAMHNLNYRLRYAVLSIPGGYAKITLADILYIESENAHVIVHTAGETYRTRSTLTKFAEQLDDTFFKTHRSFIVGLRYVKKITNRDITLLNGEILPISRGKYDEVHRALIKYL